MRVFLTGATGFLGRALVLALRREGHEVLAWVRSPARARSALGDQAEILALEAGAADLRAALGRCQAVVNLAGAPILARWSARRKAELRSSRVDLTARLVAALEESHPRPSVLVSGSAVGFYGASSEARSETSPAGSDFLAGICRDWEAEALRAEPLGLRVVLVRTAVVLGLDGGALVTMLPAFRARLGGRIGSGRQPMPWIHVVDWVRLVLAALGDERYRGPLNAVAPEAVTNREFTRTLAATLARPAPFPVPGLALRLLFGGGAEVLLAGQRVVPERAQQLGFVHAFPTLAQALADLLRDGRPVLARQRGAAWPAGEAPRGVPPPTRTLALRTELGAPASEVFAFFSRPENLGLLTPLARSFELVSPPAAPAICGTRETLETRVRFGPLRVAWRTRFLAWDPPGRFVDLQERGPFRTWWHEHRFEPRRDAAGGATLMHDRVLYALPLGPLGSLAHRLFVADALGDLFRQRAIALHLRFGAPGEVGT